jgi:hypothetical protein
VNSYWAILLTKKGSDGIVIGSVYDSKLSKCFWHIHAPFLDSLSNAFFERRTNKL